MRLDRRARPSKLTALDHYRMAAAVARGEAERALEIRREKTARAVYWAACIIVGIAFIYGI